MLQPRLLADGLPRRGHEMLFDAHTRALAALGGVAARGIYDNMNTAVDKVKNGKGQGKAGRIADSMLRLDAIILDEPGYLPFSQAGGAL